MKKLFLLILLSISTFGQVVTNPGAGSVPNATTTTPGKVRVGEIDYVADSGAAAAKPCNASRVNTKRRRGYGNRGIDTCTETSTGVYAWVEDDVTVSAARFGVVASSPTGTDITTFLQNAMDAAEAHSNVNITGAGGGQESVGGGILQLPPSTSGYRISSTINVTRTKVTIRGPAVIYIDAGVTAFNYAYSGSTSKSGVIFENIDFVGGAIAIDTGANAVPVPLSVYKCKFVNQTTAGIKIGSNGFTNTIRDSVFTGCAYGIWHNGDAADKLLVDHNTFIYNSDYDIYVVNANAFDITNNNFVGNLKSPSSDQANIYISVVGAAQTGSYSRIIGNKFGQESRTGGNIIKVVGTSSASVVTNLTIKQNLLQFPAGLAGSYAIKADTVQMRGWKVQDNNLTYCQLLDYSAENTLGTSGQNVFEPNTFNPAYYPQLSKANHLVEEWNEPQAWDKANIAAYSRYVNAGASFTYSNATPTYMASTDENGIANNATAVLATSAANVIRVNSINTNNQQIYYSLSLWLKLDTAGDVVFKLVRGSDYAINNTFRIGTSWQRVTFRFYQTHLATGFPYVFDLTIPNGATVTLGGLTVVPGRDVGDLKKTATTTERFGVGIFASTTPADIYYPVGTVVWNSAPSAGGVKGWVCTASGVPGTWAAFYDTPQALTTSSAVQFGTLGLGAAVGANTIMNVGSGNSGVVNYNGYYNNGTYNLYQRYGGYDFAGASSGNLYIGGITAAQWADLNLMASGATVLNLSTAGVKLGSKLAISTTAPTVTSAGTSPSITASNGTAAFIINVGTGGTATDIVLAMPTANAGWICHANNITATAANRADQAVRLTASTTTSVTLQNQTVSTGAALAFTASDVVHCQCTAY